MNETRSAGLYVEPGRDRCRVRADRVAGATAPSRQQLAIRAGVKYDLVAGHDFSEVPHLGPVCVDTPPH
jgi:hypothetical protein